VTALRTVRAAGLVACLAAATLLVLVAVDAHAWGTRMPSDDVRFRHQPLERDLWQPRQLAPFGLARKVLGIDDNLRYRHALQAFRVGRPLESLFDETVTGRRIHAQVALQQFLTTSNDDRRKSQAANLIGVLGFAAATQDARQQSTFLNNAIASFKTAIALDPSNDDAYYNLEYALDQLKEATANETGSGKKLGGTGGAGAREAGHGY
jgi:hypothetical protein